MKILSTMKTNALTNVFFFKFSQEQFFLIPLLFCLVSNSFVVRKKNLRKTPAGNGDLFVVQAVTLPCRTSMPGRKRDPKRWTPSTRQPCGGDRGRYPIPGDAFTRRYIYVFAWNPLMTSIFEGQPHKTRPFPFKTRVIWVQVSKVPAV